MRHRVSIQDNKITGYYRDYDANDGAWTETEARSAGVLLLIVACAVGWVVVGVLAWALWLRG